MNANDSDSSSRSISRRHFLAASAAIPAALLAQSPLTSTAKAEEAAKKIPLGLELYSVRDELAKDLPETLKTVAGDGYEVVEFYAPYYGWTLPYAKEVRAQMDDLGIRCYSTHNSFTSFTPDGMGKAIELNQILGTRTLVCASAPNPQGLDGWKHFAEQMTEAAEKLKPHGLSAGFHNHDAEWATLDGDKRIMDVLAANTPKEFVLQLDVGTCVKAGGDPVAWINANPGRIHSLHLKDWSPSGSYEVLFGEGTCPWKEIMAAAEAVGGVEYYLVEQEGSRYSEFETVQRCLASLKKMRGAS